MTDRIRGSRSRISTNISLSGRKAICCSRCGVVLRGDTDKYLVCVTCDKKRSQRSVKS